MANFVRWLQISGTAEEDSVKDWTLFVEETYTRALQNNTRPTREELSPEQCLRDAISTGIDGELLTGLWYVGVVLSIFSSIISNLGVNIQKVRHSILAAQLFAELSPHH